MTGLISFLLSFMMGVGDAPTGEKRKDRSPLVKLDVKKSRAMEDAEIDSILKKKPILKELAALGKFKIDTLRDFFEHHDIDITVVDVTGSVKELFKKGYINEDICLMTKDGNTTDMLSEVVANYKAARLEEQFEMKLRMEEVDPLEIKEDDLADPNKARENLIKMSKKINELHEGVSVDLKTLRGKAKTTESERVVNTLLASKEELLVSGLNLQNAPTTNGYELGVFCRQTLRTALLMQFKDDLDKPVNNVGDITGNVGLEILNIFDASDVRALGKTPRILQGMMTMPVMIKANSVRAKEKMKDAIINIAGLKARDSIPKNYQTQRTNIHETVKSLKRYQPESCWVRVDLMSIRIGVEPTFKVSTKNSAEQGGKWTNIGTVLIRDPGMYGQLTSASVRENILVELNLIDE